MLLSAEAARVKARFTPKVKRGADRLPFQDFDGAPGEIRTPDLLIRSQSLYPAELRAHTIGLLRNH